MPSADSAVAHNRALASLAVRVHRLEDALKKLDMSTPDSSFEKEFPTRDSISIKDIEGISEDERSKNTMLASMYASEHGKLTEFAIGTWPDKKFVSDSCVIHGCEVNSKNQILEVMRGSIIPTMIKAQIPFSNITVDPGEEYPVNKIRDIVNSACSHLILLTPNLYNYREAISMAYISGRGNGNTHLVRFDHNPFSFPGEHESVRNLFGPALSHSPKHRTMEVDRMLSVITSGTPSQEYKTLFHDDETSFGKCVIFRCPEELKRTKTVDTLVRNEIWSSLIENPPTSDIGILILCSFLGGMLSPGNTSRFTRVQKESIKESDHWIGVALVLRLLSPVLLPSEHSPKENTVRDALLFFNQLVGPAFD